MSKSGIVSMAAGVSLVAALSGCASSSDQPGGSSTGGAQTGGSGVGQTGGTSATGGTPGSGGSNASGSGGADVPATGGSRSGSGGASATGGTTGSGGATGGGSGGSGGATSTATGGSGGIAGTGGGATAGQTGTTTCPAGTFICENFDSYPTGAAPTGIWSKDTRGSGTVAVDATRAFSGKNSLHVTATINGSAAHITTPVAITVNTTFVRLMMYTVGYPSSSGVHSHLARLGTTADSGPDSAYSLSSYNGTAIEKVDSIYLRSTATKLNDASLRNRWVCIEFEIDKTGGVGKVVPHIWIDGSALTLAAAGSTTHAGTSASWDPIPFQKFTLGLDGNQADAVKGDFWLDDVVIASTRIGCSK